MPDSRPVHLIQISDCHLHGNPRTLAKGVSTFETLAATVAAIGADEDVIDAVVASGDLSNDWSDDSYLHFADLTRALGAPVYALPGNHDDPAQLVRVLSAEGVLVRPGADIGAWRLIFLDSVIRGEINGRLGSAKLAALDAELAGAEGRFALVFLHHHPVAVGRAWEDVPGVADAEAFFAVLDRHANVRGVAWGHIHFGFESERRGVRLVAAPSTCMEVVKDAETGLAYGRPAPGYRRFRLHADGRLDTEEVPVRFAGARAAE
jgi:Icc protein